MLETRIRQFLAANSLLEPEDRVLVAYSGGPDSTCLLLLLREIHPETAAVYVNHRLRGEESVQEEAFVRNFCEKRGIPLYVEHLSWRKQPSNLEETARKRRYLHLTKAAQEHGFTKVALAHHSDDAAETFLLRLLRGSGPRGLAGPMPRRGLFIRPLLNASHAEILSYLQDREIPFFADSSNQDPQHLRNRIRLELLPVLEKHYNPKIRNALNRAALWMGEQNLLLAELLKSFEHCIHKQDGAVRILKRDLEPISVPLRKELLRLAIHHADPSLRPDSGLLTRILGILDHEEILELPGYLMVESSRNAIAFRAKTGTAGFFEIDVPGAGSFAFPPGDSVLIFSMETGVVVEQDPNVACLDAEKAGFPLIVRNWKKGDRFHPLGMEGTRKLSDFWIDRKVPRAERKRIPLVFKDDDLVWVAGHRLSHDCRITEATRKVLKIELKK